MLKNRAAFRGAACALAAVLACGCAFAPRPGREAPVPSFRLELIGDVNFPTGGAPEGLNRESFGGISSLAFDPPAGELLALTDDKEDYRIFKLRPSLAIGRLEVRALGVLSLRDAQGRPFPPLALDPEGLVRLPDGGLVVSSEGTGAEDTNPKIFLFAPDGLLEKEFPVPDKFLPASEGSEKRGTRPNEAFESLTLAIGGKSLFTAGETTLYQDGEPSSPERGGLARILEYDLTGPEPRAVAEYAYPLDPVAVPADRPPGRGMNGLVELVALGGDEFLSMERSFFREEGKEVPRRTRTGIRIYRFSLAGAGDVSGAASLGEAGAARAVRKVLVLDLDDIIDRLSPGFRSLDNFEAMCFGPALPNGHRTLLLASDNNFSPDQRTAFLAFEVVPR